MYKSELGRIIELSLNRKSATRKSIYGILMPPLGPTLPRFILFGSHWLEGDKPTEKGYISRNWATVRDVKSGHQGMNSVLQEPDDRMNSEAEGNEGFSCGFIRNGHQTPYLVSECLPRSRSPGSQLRRDPSFHLKKNLK